MVWKWPPCPSGRLTGRQKVQQVSTRDTAWWKLSKWRRKSIFHFRSCSWLDFGLTCHQLTISAQPAWPATPPLALRLWICARHYLTLRVHRSSTAAPALTTHSLFALSVFLERLHIVPGFSWLWRTPGHEKFHFSSTFIFRPPQRFISKAHSLLKCQTACLDFLLHNDNRAFHGLQHYVGTVGEVNVSEKSRQRWHKLDFSDSTVS